MLRRGLAQAGLQGADGLGDDLQLPVGAIGQQLLRLPLENGLGGRQAVAQQLIRRHIQGVGQADQGGQAQLCGAPLNVGDVRRLLLRQLGQSLLGQPLGFPQAADPGANRLIVPVSSLESG